MTLLELLDLMRKKKTLVIVMPLVFALVTAVFCWGFMPNQYTATISMYILSGSNTESSTNTSLNSDLSASQMLANDFAEIAKSDRVRTKTAEDLQMSSLNGYSISVKSSTTTRVISVSVTGANPEAVSIIANQVGIELQDIAVSVMALESVNVIDEATPPTTPSGPNRGLYTLVALLVGFLLAIAIVVISDMLNTTFRTPEQAEEMLGIPVLGRMQTVKKKGR